MSEAQPTSTAGPRLIVGAGVLAYVLAMGWLLQMPYDIAGGVLVGHVLAVVTVPLLMWLTRHDDRPTRRLVLAALVAKLVGTMLRYFFVFVVYKEGDARQYDEVGRVLAGLFRHGQFSVDLGNKLVGTGFIELLTGILYTVIGPTKVGGFLVFSWLGFWGLYLFYRAFRIALPDGDHRRYGLLIFFLPSMVFWPSSIGKDAWMALTLGLIAYGAARMVARRGSGLLFVVAGTLGSAMVRPHITVMAVAALMASYLLASSSNRSYAAPLIKLAGSAALVGVFAFAFLSVQNFFKLADGGSVEEVFDKTNVDTTKGTSFKCGSGPVCAFSVLFRPLPIEARNPQILFASLEGAVLLVLFVMNVRRLRNFLPRRRNAYLTFAATYSAMFVVAFSNVANFGILARQRVQLFPLVFVALAVPVLRKTTRAPVPVVAGPRTGPARQRPRVPTPQVSSGPR
ncbi:MAG: hypothetical protein ACRDV9_07180 [Acidimicrobiia bacterium]